jgi:hypothetical protein
VKIHTARNAIERPTAALMASDTQKIKARQSIPKIRRERNRIIKRRTRDVRDGDVLETSSTAAIISCLPRIAALWIVER